MEANLKVYLQHFGNITLEDLEKILDSKLPNDEKIICIRGWLKLYKTATYGDN